MCDWRQAHREGKGAGSMAQNAPKGAAGMERQLLWQAGLEWGDHWGALLQGGFGQGKEERNKGCPLWFGGGEAGGLSE